MKKIKIISIVLLIITIIMSVLVSAQTINQSYILVGGGTTGTVQRFLASDLSFVDQSASMGGNILAMNVYNNEFIYAGGWTSTTKKITKYDAVTLEVLAESPDYGGSIRAISAPGDGYVYAGGGINIGDPISYHVKRYDASTLAYVDQSPNYGGEIQNLLVPGDGYVYVVGGGSNRLRRYNQSTWAFAGETPSYGMMIKDVHVPGDGFVYITGMYTNKIRKYDYATLAFINESEPYGNTTTSYIQTSDMPGDGNVYIAGQTVRTIQKFNKNDLLKIGESESYGATIFSLIVPNDGYVYAGGDGDFNIKKYDQSTLNFISGSISYGGTINKIRYLELEIQEVLGCTDLEATNYNSNATTDDGSCIYALPVEVYNSNKDVYYFTIQEAINAASAGDTIELMSMVYYENLIINKSLNIIGTSSSSSIIKGVLNDEHIISVRGTELEKIEFSLAGVTLDHQNMISIAQFGSVSGLDVQYVNNLIMNDVRAINFGDDHQYERGGFNLNEISGADIRNVVVDNVHGQYTRGFRVQSSDGLYFENISVTNLQGANHNDWMFYIYETTNSVFENLHAENISTPTWLPNVISVTASKNLSFNDVVIKNVQGYNAVAIRGQYSEELRFTNILIENVTGSFIASPIDFTHDDVNLGCNCNHYFENITIKSVDGAIQARAINLDRGTKNTTFKNILIEDLKGYLSGTTGFSVIGIQLNVRDPNGNTENNLFQNVTIRNINTTGKFYGVVLNSLATNAYNTNNVFNNINIRLNEEDYFSDSIGFYDDGDCNNSLINSYFNGFNKSIQPLIEESNCLLVLNNTILNNELLLENIDVELIDDYCMNNYFDFLSYKLNGSVVHGNLKNTFSLFNNTNIS